MNILLINHYAGSPQHGMEYRAYYLAREWVKMGNNVQIIASAHSHVRTIQPNMQGNDRLNEIIEGIQYVWLNTPAYSGNGIGRVRNMASFVCQLYMESTKLAISFKPDIVIASSTYPMDIWPACRIAKLAKAKLIYEVHDLWPLSPIELGGMSRMHPFILLVQAAEDYAYRHTDIVISMLPKVRDYMVSRGMASQKLHIVPNGIDPSEWENAATALNKDVNEIFLQFKAQGFFIIGYAGAHGIANALDTLLDAAKLMVEENCIFVLVGDGQKKVALQQRVQIEGLKNVIFFDPVKKYQIPKLLEKLDVAYIGLQRQTLFRFGIAPNKLMDYMMAARPVLMAIESGNDPVGESNCGLTVRPEDPEAIANGIRSLLRLTNEERKQMGLRGRSYVLKKHTYPVLAQKFLTACR